MCIGSSLRDPLCQPLISTSQQYFFTECTGDCSFFTMGGRSKLLEGQAIRTPHRRGDRPCPCTLVFCIDRLLINWRVGEKQSIIPSNRHHKSQVKNSRASNTKGELPPELALQLRGRLRYKSTLRTVREQRNPPLPGPE